MGLLSFLEDWLRSNNVKNTNRNRRGITYYKPSHISGFVGDDGYQNNIICSGGSSELRSEMIASLCIVATNANVPIIILHQGDTDLTNRLRSVYTKHSAYIEINSNSYYFDPFYDMTRQQISKIIVDTSPQKYNMTSDAEAFIDVITGLIEYRGRNVCLHDMADCPASKLSLAVQNIASKYALAPSVVSELQINLAQGQAESRKVMAYLKELYVECANFLPQHKSDYQKCVSLPYIVKHGMVMNFNVVSEQNTLLLRIIAEQLQLLVRNRQMFYLVIDDIPVTDENSLSKICNGRSGSIKYAMCSGDLYSICGGDEKMFGSVLGSSKKWFVFQHTSGISADKWSGAFTKYKKIGVTTNHSRHKGGGWGLGGPLFGKPFLNWNNNAGYQQGVSYKDEDEAVIRAEEIIRIPSRGGYIYSSDDREIAYVDHFLPF